MRATLLMVLLLMGAAFAHAQGTDSGRYQLVPAEVPAVGGTGMVHDLFLLDTQTGRVWLFHPAIGKMRTIPPSESGTENITGLTQGVFAPVERWDSFPDLKKNKRPSPAVPR